MRIEAIQPLRIAPQVEVQERGATPEANFGEMLMEILRQVNETQNQAGNLAQRFAAGEPVEEHTLMIAMERANLALQLTLQVRNRVLEAYQEMMRMQI